MTNSFNSIRPVNIKAIDEHSYAKHLADCVILTQDNRLLLQKRPENWGSCPGALNIFGGHVEDGETVLEGLIRELHEEVGAQISPEEIVFIGAVTEDWTDHTELVHIHFWHDKKGTITGCYEAEPRHFDSVQEALKHPRIMDYTRWALQECENRGLLSACNKKTKDFLRPPEM